MSAILASAILFGFLSNVPVESEGGPQRGAMALEVLVDAGLTDRNLGAALLDHLRVELAAAHVAVTSAGSAGAPAADARLTVGPVSGNPRAVSLEVQYLRSGTAVHRTVDLASLPADGALLAIAVAVDELLRSSWSLSGVAPAPPRSATPVVSAAPPPRVSQAEARLLLAAERHSDGVVTLGPDVVLVVPIGSRFSADVRGGWRRAGSRQTSNGSVDSTAVTGGVGIAFALPARTAAHRAGAELSARIDGAWVNMQGTANSAAAAYGATAFGVAAVGGVGGWLTVIEPLRLIVFAGWQLPLRSVTALDGDRSAGAVFHPGFSAAAGLGARF